ncbi:MAG: hypothetical protein HDT22_04990 [Ruminococcus sp.]|nr:hypothetical protein [Ruminococcus sp.]
MNHIKYAFSKFSFWFSWFATIIGVVTILDLSKLVRIIIVLGCFLFSFIIPFISSFIKKNFEIHTIGKSKVALSFGDLFDEECFLVTTNLYFDVNPTGEYISEDSLLGNFVRKFFPNNVAELEEKIRCELQKHENNITPTNYGKTIRINLDEKIIYFMAFTDRRKTNQPEDFYIKAVQSFLKEIINENHGKTICIPLLGNNNNLSNSGFSDSKISLLSFVSMINYFEIINQRSQLNIKIIALPEERSNLLDIIAKI